MARKKAPNGSGTQPRRRADGRWEARVQIGLDPLTGKPIMKSVYGKTSKECNSKLLKLASAVDQGTYIEPSKMTVGQWLDIWTKDYLNSIKPSTIDSYKSRIETYLKPHLGTIKLAALNPHSVQALYNKLYRSEKNPDGCLSAKSVKNLHGVLHKAMKQAVLLGYIQSNPTEACDLPRVIKKEVSFLEEEDVKKLLKAVEGHKFERVYKVDLFTGLRQGEILGLTWDCIDFAKGVLTVSKQLQRDRDNSGKYSLVSCKTDRIRKIKPADFVMNMLRQQRQKQNEDKLKAGSMWGNEWNLVFTNEVGEHLSTSTVYKNFKKIVEKIGIPRTRFHDMRHTYATLSLQNGDDIKTVQANIGHATASFTLDVYGHVSQKMQQDSADRMQNYIDELTKTS